MQQQLDTTERDAIIERLKQNADNNKCIDCEKKNPKWASVYLGVFLCIDCAGKHREYGVQISFVRSLTLDSWSQRQITFMENGGNTKAQDYFKKYGLSRPYDYKSSTAQKYKQDLTKKVDSILDSEKASSTALPPKMASQAPVSQTEKPAAAQILAPGSLPKPEVNPNAFFENITIAKPVTKSPFTVEFAKEKPQFPTGKNTLQAKKIANFDLDNLTLEESDGKPQKKDLAFSMNETNGMVSSPTLTTTVDKTTGVKEVSHKTGTTGSSSFKDKEAEDNLKKFSNAKSISSSQFYGTDNNQNSMDYKRFNGATAISSAQVFGYEEEEPTPSSYNIDTDQIKDMFAKVGGKLKEKAGTLMNKLKNDWESN
jgi:ADP-ribosylation factor GTPase-activating protein 2/3